MTSAARLGRTLTRQFEYLTAGATQKKLLTAVMKRAKSQANMPDGGTRILFDEYELRVARPAAANTLVSVPDAVRPLLEHSARLTWRGKDQPTCLVDHAELCLEEESSAALVEEDGMEDIFDGQPTAYKVLRQGPDCWFLHPTLPGVIFWDHASNNCRPFNATAGWVFLRIMARSLELANVPDLSPLLPAAPAIQLSPIKVAAKSLSRATFLAFGYPQVTLPVDNVEPKRKFFKNLTLVDHSTKLAVLVRQPVAGEANEKYHLVTWDSQSGVPTNCGRIAIEDSRVFFSGDMRRVAYCTVNKVEIWSWGERAERLCTVEHSCVKRARFSDDGRIVHTHGNGTYVGVWDCATGQTVVPSRRQPENPSGSDIAAIDFERGVLLLATQGNHVPAVYAVGSRKPEISLAAHEDELHAVALSHDASLVASADVAGLVMVFERATGNVVGRFQQPGLYAENLSFSPDNRWLLAMSTCADNAIQDRVVLWNLQTGASPIHEECYSTPAIWMPDSQSFVVADYWANLRQFKVP